MNSKDHIAAFAKAIGYPEEVPPGRSSFDFMVDGIPVTVKCDGDSLLLVRILPLPEESALRELASLAPGRILKEEATLSFDRESQSPVLWQKIPLSFPEALAVRAFEAFLTSSDWWFARLEQAKSASSLPEMVIMP